MARRSTIFTVIAILAPTAAQAQWVPQRTGTTAEFRGISAAGERVVWAGGKGGVYARTTDGGATWRADTVPGATTLFFVDAHAVSADTAYLLGTDFREGVADGRIYKTVDGGRDWTLQLRDTTGGVFLDGMAFWDAEHGIAFGDPVGGAFVVFTTGDGGATWTRVPAAALPAPLEGEASFAASGTAITTRGTGDVWFGTGGGAHARVYHSSDRGRTWTAAATPLPGGKTAGIFGVAFRDSLHGLAVGGDYSQPRGMGRNVLRTDDGGTTWTLAGQALPAGVRYGAVFVPGRRELVVAAGPSGSGYSTDGGAHWMAIDTVGYNTVVFASPEAGWAAGTDGRIARWEGKFAGPTSTGRSAAPAQRVGGPGATFHGVSALLRPAESDGEWAGMARSRIDLR